MAKTVLDFCNHLFQRKDVVKPGDTSLYTALPTGQQFCVLQQEDGISISMSHADLKNAPIVIAKKLVPSAPGVFSTPALKLFRKSVALPRPGLYRYRNALIHVYVKTTVCYAVYVLQKTVIPTWLARRLINPQEWWASAPERLQALPSAVYGSHPDGGDIIALKRVSLWYCYIKGSERLLTSDEIIRLVADNKLRPVNIKD